MHKVSGTLEVMPPFNLSMSARFLEKFTPTEGEQEIQPKPVTSKAETTEAVETAEVV